VRALNILFTITFFQLELCFQLAEEDAVLLYTFAQLGFQLGWIVCLIQSLRRRGNA